LGNPIGVLIALRAGLTFEDFLTHALPIAAAILGATVCVLCLWYRSYIKEVSVKLMARQGESGLVHFAAFDRGKKLSLVIFVVMILVIALHKRLGTLFGVDENSLLVIIPVIFAGVVMLCWHNRVRHYIEKEVEWMSLLFFMFLFAQAGVIQSSGVAQFVAEKLVKHAGTSQSVLSGVTLFSSGFLSGILDNTVVVASYIPVVKNLHVMDISLKTLWWAMLFGACFGGNLTAIGSTANIVALGLLEQRKLKVSFYQWLKLGAIVTVVGMLIAYFSLIAFLGSPIPST
jgi:Na+/H+ antiporter NhaD/arsenite permease-like protein